MSSGSNTIHTTYTNESLASKFVTENILTHFQNPFVSFVDQNGLSVVKIMYYIETAAVMRDVGVSERNICNVLQRNLKFKLNGKKSLKMRTLKKSQNACHPSPPLSLCLNERKERRRKLLV